ncbi:MAG: tRNA pseudouridine synthase A [Rikenellaceae bacterium]
MRYFISLSYRGTAYCGWQIQINKPSVQAELERAFSIYLGNETRITGAGRTDAGVHAINYIAHFDSANPILTQDYPKLIYKINAILPPDITLHNIYHVSDDAHARFDAVSRTYKYYIHTKKDSFLNQYSYFFPYDLDLEKMNSASSFLLGKRDFTSMAKLHSDVTTNICTVSEAIWTPCSPLNFKCEATFSDPSSLSTSLSHSLPFSDTISDFLSNSIPNSISHPLSVTTFCFTITANRFLRNMVRAVVGSLLEVGRGKQEPTWIEEILEQKNRCFAGSSVPAHPLFLTNIEYPYNIF